MAKILCRAFFNDRIVPDIRKPELRKTVRRKMYAVKHKAFRAVGDR
jgi:hypothetical protein